MVDHNILFYKCFKIYAINIYSTKWLRNYLSSRSQVVMLYCYLLRLLSITCGGPQGSIIHLLLYGYYLLTNSQLSPHHPEYPLTPAPHCHGCGGTWYHRGSLFAPPRFFSCEEEAPVVDCGHWLNTVAHRPFLSCVPESASFYKGLGQIYLVDFIVLLPLSTYLEKSESMDGFWKGLRGF